MAKCAAMPRRTGPLTGLDRLQAPSSVAPVAVASPTVIAFIGGSGGVGASIIASAVAYVSTASNPALLLDLDPLGGGLDLVLAAESAPGLRWPQLQHVRGVLEKDSLRPVVSATGVHVVSHGRDFMSVSTDAICAVITAAQQKYPLVVIDLPRDFSDRNVLSLIDHVFVVVGGDVRACASALQIVQRLKNLHSHLSAVVRTSDDAVRIAEYLGIPLAAEVLWEPRLSHDVSNGITPGSRKRGQVHVGAEQLLLQLSVQASPKRRRLMS